MNQVPIIQQHNDYLHKATLEIRARSIPWEGYQRASLISEDELAQIRQFEKSPSAALAEAGPVYISMFLNLLQKLIRTDTIQNILVLIDDLLVLDANAPGIFFSLSADPATGLPFAPFTRLLRKDDEYIQLKAAKICVALLLEAPVGFSFDPSDIFSWLCSQLAPSSAKPDVLDISVQYLQALLALPEYRKLFFSGSSSGVQMLVDMIKSSDSSAQMQYQTIYVLWLLSFDPEIAASLQPQYDVIPSFLNIARSAIKEKVVRIILATIRNMIDRAPGANMPALLGCKALNVFETLAARKWRDEEIPEDLQHLNTEMATIVSNLSTFDEYAAEVRAGRLEWSPAHKSEHFWKQNAVRMNEKDYELLRALSRLISTSQEPLILAVAAHDFGQYLKHYPSGKRVIQDIGAKTQIMELMSHPDGDVRYEALLAVQKLLIMSH